MVSARSEVVSGRPALRSVGSRLFKGEFAMDDMRTGTAAGLIATDDVREGMLLQEKQRQKRTNVVSPRSTSVARKVVTSSNEKTTYETLLEELRMEVEREWPARRIAGELAEGTIGTWAGCAPLKELSSEACLPDAPSRDWTVVNIVLGL